MTKHDKAPLSRKRILKDIVLDEISAVDKPMNAPSRVAILKRAGYDDRSMESALTKRIALTSMTSGHGHSILTDSEGGEKQVGTTSWAADHTHDWVMDEAGNIILAEADGHTHGIGVLIMKGTEDLTEILPEGGPLADLLRMGVEPASDTSKATKMTDEEKKAAELAKTELGKAVSERDANQKRAERLDVIVKLSPELRKHFDAQNETGQDEFLAKTSEEQNAIVKNAQDADPIVYTANDGRSFRKSANQDLVSEVKRNDTLEKRLADGDKLRKRADVEKQASADLGHLTGELSAKADLLEAVEMLPVEKREPVKAILKAQDAGLAVATKRLGTTLAPDSDNSAEGDWDAFVKSIQEKDGLDEPAATAKAATMPRGQELYKRMYS